MLADMTAFFIGVTHSGMPSLASQGEATSQVTPACSHAALTDGSDGEHGKEERAHKLPAPHAGGTGQEMGPIFVCLNDVLEEKRYCSDQQDLERGN